MHRESHPVSAVAPAVAAGGAEPQGHPEPTALRLELRPRCALQPATAQRVFLVSCAIVLSVAVAAAAIGAWPALVFAGIELLLLRAALHYSLQQGEARQVVEIDEGHVRVGHRPSDGLAPQVFPRHWARVKLQTSDSMLERSRLLLECSGKHCELGAFLGESERRALAQRLTGLIGGIGESPRLALRTPSDEDGGYEHIG